MRNGPFKNHTTTISLFPGHRTLTRQFIDAHVQALGAGHGAEGVEGEVGVAAAQQPLHHLQRLGAPVGACSGHPQPARTLLFFLVVCLFFNPSFLIGELFFTLIPIRGNAAIAVLLGVVSISGVGASCADGWGARGPSFGPSATRS